MAKPDVYQQVTDRILEALGNGTAPWRKPWISERPISIRSGKPYRGINVFLLDMAGYSDPRWGTFKAMKEQGGHVRKGEKATHVILWKPVVRRTIDAPEGTEGMQTLDNTYMLLRSYAVFNAEQCDELPPHDVPLREHSPHERAEQVVIGYVPGPTIAHQGDRAAYSPTIDLVVMPKPEAFESQEAYYSTLFHELVHSTGHKDRLDRLESTQFGSSPYAKEELVAEMGAAMLCGTVGIDNLDGSASYVQGWLEKLTNDRKLVVQAAALAQKACDFMLGTTFEDSQESENREEAQANA